VNVAVVGGAGGIGVAICDKITSLGGSVAIIDRKPVDRPYPSITVDLADVDASERALSGCYTQFGAIPDSIVYCAAVHHMAEIGEFSRINFHETMQVNVAAAIEIELEWLRAVRAGSRSPRAIINIASAAGVRGSSDIAYAASKGALLAATRSLARAAATDLVSVVAVAPGIVRSPMSMRMSEDRRNAAIAATLIGRMGTPEEVASIVAHLAAEPNMQLSGTVLHVDGGQC
jgi:NAD(P)-dependent dehydrogenase (short-subunit alcohol dehydrogenase family)